MTSEWRRLYDDFEKAVRHAFLETTQDKVNYQHYVRHLLDIDKNRHMGNMVHKDGNIRRMQTDQHLDKT